MSQTTTQSSIRGRYLNAGNFNRFGVFRGTATGPSGWLVAGPNLQWLGEEMDSFEEALEFVRDRIRQYGATK